MSTYAGVGGMMSTAITELPNGVILGYTVHAVDVLEPMIVLSIEFHVGAGEFTARQNLLIHPEDAKSIRDMLDNPQPLPSKEDDNG